MPTPRKSHGNRLWARVWIGGKMVDSKMFGIGAKHGKEWQKAKAWELARKEEILKERSQATSTALPLLVWAVEYLEDSKLRHAEKTFPEKYSAINRFVEFAGPKKPVQEVTSAVARAYLKEQKVKRSPNAANKDRKNLAEAWDWGRATWLDSFPETTNPFRAVKKYPEERTPRYVPPMDDFERVLAASEGQDRAMLLFALHTGARKGEIFRVTWADVDFPGGRVRLTTQKTKGKGFRADWVAMSQDLQEALLWWLEKRPYQSESVFCVLDDTPCPHHNPGSPFKARNHFMARLCKRAGLEEGEYFGFHALRHLCAVTLYKAGTPLWMIQKHLRHQSPNTTARYLQSLGLDLAEMGEHIAAAFGRGAGEKKNPRSGSFEGSSYPASVSSLVN